MAAERRQKIAHGVSRGRSVGRFPSPSTVERIPDPAGPELATIWDEEWSKHLLRAALARIKRQVHPQQYEIYHLHVILEKPVREVAKALGVNIGQVYLAKHRVGALLRKEMKRLQTQDGVETLKRLSVEAWER